MKILKIKDIFDNFKGKQPEIAHIKEEFKSFLKNEDIDKIQLNRGLLLKIYRFFTNLSNYNMKSIIDFIEKEVGEKFIKKYNIEAKEAMGLSLLEDLVKEEILNDDENPNITAPNVSIRKENGHITSLDINQVNCPEMKLLDFFPYLRFLRICLANLNNLSGLESLELVEFIDFHSNNLSIIPNLSPLKNLRTLYIDNNPIINLPGVEELTNLTYLETNETKIPLEIEDRIQHIVTENRLREKERKN